MLMNLIVIRKKENVQEEKRDEVGRKWQWGGGWRRGGFAMVDAAAAAQTQNALTVTSPIYLLSLSQSQ